MKNILKFVIALLILITVVPNAILCADPVFAPVSVDTDFRGVWVATVLNIDYPSKPITDSELLKEEAVGILEDVRKLGFNAVFLQVRPTSDALYKSNLFPWSKYLTGIQGQAPGSDFDPLSFWVEEAHKRGIQLHAWINPYRITKKIPEEKDHDFASLLPSHPAILNPTWVVPYKDGNLYYNPGLPEVRKFIIDGVMEIVNQYNVDGIHFDDYFYPGSDFNDQETFTQYGSGYANIDDFRRSNVDILIKDLSLSIKAIGKNIPFGISPFGIWANKKTNPLGSDTRGAESYTNHYADTRKWVKDGIIDYIAPQIYWNIGYSVADYSKLISWWQEVVKGTGVKLYIGQAAYRTGVSSSSSPWYGVNQIEKQLELNKTIPEIKGSIFFSYGSFVKNPALKAMVKGYYERKDGKIAATPVVFSRPLGNIQTKFTSFYLHGASDPNQPLFLNGEPVENRSKDGYFGVLVPLKEGVNLFTIAQEGTYETRVIQRTIPTKEPQKLNSPMIPTDSTFPQTPEYRKSGEKITLTCIAPVGAKVTVKIGGKTFSMVPEKTSWSATGMIGTSYRYVYTLPTFKGTPRNIDLGQPLYTMKYKGAVKTKKAPAKVVAIMNQSPFYGKVIKSFADTYHTSKPVNGANYELSLGMVDYVTGITGKYVRLGSGQWVAQSSIKTYTTKLPLNPKISSTKYSVGEKWETFEIRTKTSMAALADFDGVTLRIRHPLSNSKINFELPNEAVFKEKKVKNIGSRTVYEFILKENQRIDGYYVEKTKTGISLRIKKHMKVGPNQKDLSGITIMLDPGHGGKETGAIGPLGLQYSEKNINLKLGLKLQENLENLGARVLMTRTSDLTLSLESRLAASRREKPDLFISIHANSMEDNVDISKVSGFSIYYREAFAKPLSGFLYQHIIEDLKREEKGIHAKNFYVNRGTWTPSLLLETGFVPNPDEFEWLINEEEQTKLAQSLSEGILKYFLVEQK